MIAPGDGIAAQREARAAKRYWRNASPEQRSDARQGRARRDQIRAKPV